MKEINVLRLKKRNWLKQKKKQISIKSWSKDPQSVQCLWSFLQREEMRGRISLLSAFFTVLMILANLLPTKITLFGYFFLDVKKIIGIGYLRQKWWKFGSWKLKIPSVNYVEIKAIKINCDLNSIHEQFIS